MVMVTQDMGTMVIAATETMAVMVDLEIAMVAMDQMHIVDLLGVTHMDILLLVLVLLIKMFTTVLEEMEQVLLLVTLQEQIEIM